MEASSHRNAFRPSPSNLRTSDPIAPVAGALPPRPVEAEPPKFAAELGRDGVLRVGQYTLSFYNLTRHLEAFAQMTNQIRSMFPTKDHLAGVLPKGEIPIPMASLDFNAAMEVFERAQSGQITDRYFRLPNPSGNFSEEELGMVREILMTGARLATVCEGIDLAITRALEYRSVLQRGKDWLFDLAGSMSIGDGRIQSKLIALPFERFNARSRRIDADMMAQRIDLREDGSLAVRAMCDREREAVALLSQAELSWSVELSRGGLETWLRVKKPIDAAESKEGRDPTLYARSHRIDDVFAVLQLGQAASKMIEMMTGSGVNLQRIGCLFDRDLLHGIKINQDAIIDQTHLRLSDVDLWKTRFTREGLPPKNSDCNWSTIEPEMPYPLSTEERAELALLLLEAESCLLLAAHLQIATQSEQAKSFWRKLWVGSIKDQDVRAAQELVSQAPSPMHDDCLGAAAVASNAAMLLGYHSEDRTDDKFKVPENPVVSLSWSINQSDDPSPAPAPQSTASA